MGTVRYDVMEWVADQKRRDEGLRKRVDEELAAMLIEQQLIRLREARGLSQSQLARVLGVSPQAIAKAESGHAKNIELRTLLRHVLALGGRLEVRIEPDGKAYGRPLTRPAQARRAQRTAGR